MVFVEPNPILNSKQIFCCFQINFYFLFTFINLNRVLLVQAQYRQMCMMQQVLRMATGKQPL